MARERGEKEKGETFVSPGVFSDASGGILSVTAQVIEAKSASLYLLCRTISHRGADAVSVALEHSDTTGFFLCLHTD